MCGIFINSSGNFSARVLRSRIFLTSISTKAVLGSRFSVSVCGAQNSKGMLGWVEVIDGNLFSSNLQFWN